MDKPIVDIVRRVYVPDEGGVHIEIAPDETGEAITIQTPDAKSEEWFGKFSITVTKQYAYVLGHALIAQTTD